jgi:hypothetical protein
MQPTVNGSDEMRVTRVLNTSILLDALSDHIAGIVGECENGDSRMSLLPAMKFISGL